MGAGTLVCAPFESISAHSNCTPQGPSSEAFGAAMGGASSYDSPQAWGGGLGSMGQMSSGNQGAQGSMDDGWTGHDDDEDSTPLLQELEIYPDHIREKTLEVLNPARPIKDEYLQDADLAGPLVFCLVLGVCLLFVRSKQISGCA